MGVFRSEKMLLCQILFSEETVFDCIEALGHVGLVEFQDLNSSINQHRRRHVADVRRCEEMERKLRLVENEIRNSGMEVAVLEEVPSAPGAKETLYLESRLETLVAEVETANKTCEAFKRNLIDMAEQYHVIKEASAWLQNNQSALDEEWMDEKGRGKRSEKRVGHLKITTGVILVEKIRAFETLVWRMCHGVAFVKIIHLAETLADQEQDPQAKKAVFVIICQGDTLNEKILKICHSFHCNLYHCPGTEERKNEMKKEALSGILETKEVMQQIMDHRRRCLRLAGMDLEKWKCQVVKLKSIYHVMNMLQLDENNQFQSALCWIPQDDFLFIKETLHRASYDDQHDPIVIVLQTGETPPSFSRTNKFTKGFQALIDAYGVSSYREMNPMPFTIITFPFLFAVMFGDFGHGLVLTIFGASMILFETRLTKAGLSGEIQKIFFSGRYIILLMGIFSCYTGLIYNDVFSKSVNVFGSSWKIGYNSSTVLSNIDLQLDPREHYEGYPYPLGTDPVWQVSENKIIYQNSFKMKVSIILGVTHMIFGIFLSLGNHLHSGDCSDIYTQFIPQVLFMSCLFLYLVALIFVKWVIYGPFNETRTGVHCAPSILTTFIDMMLFKNRPDSSPCPPYIYPDQNLIQTALVVTAVICIPWMLCFKTFLLLRRRRSWPDVENRADVSAMKETPPEDTEDHSSGEIIIHQVIHTIEFVLGSVSHTASYLRLWALSLAHAQLSDVLWSMVLSLGVSSRNVVGGLFLSFVFAAWAVLTLGVLVMMEGLSAFLHTLRLHWVEFQSKFYSGSGYPFRPYSFERIFETRDATDDADEFAGKANK